MSAWLAVSFLHRRLGVIQSKNSCARGWAVWGMAAGLLAAAAAESDMRFGKVSGRGFVLRVAFNCLS